MATGGANDDAPTEEGQVIVARQEEDGFITFDVKISHIVEQTLLRSFNRPDFRKSIIRVVDDPDLSGVEKGQISNQMTSASSLPPTTAASSQSTALVPSLQQATDKTRHKSNMNEQEPSTKLLETTKPAEGTECQAEQERDTQTPTFDMTALSSIPASWLSRGISSEEKRRFEQSIANASLSPFERRNIMKTSFEDDEERVCISSLSTSYSEEYSSDPFSPPTSPESPQPPPHRELTSPACELYIPPVPASPSSPTNSTASKKSLADGAADFSEISNNLAENDSSFSPPALETFHTQQYLDGEAYS